MWTVRIADRVGGRSRRAGRRDRRAGSVPSTIHRRSCVTSSCRSQRERATSSSSSSIRCHVLVIARSPPPSTSARSANRLSSTSRRNSGSYARRAGELRPVEQPRDQRMVIRRIDDPHQLRPRHVEEPSAQRAQASRAIARRGDGGEHARRARRPRASRTACSLSTSAHGSPRARSACGDLRRLSLFVRVSTITWPSENGCSTPRRVPRRRWRARRRSISTPIAPASATCGVGLALCPTAARTP